MADDLRESEADAAWPPGPLSEPAERVSFAATLLSVFAGMALLSDLMPPAAWITCPGVALLLGTGWLARGWRRPGFPARRVGFAATALAAVLLHIPLRASVFLHQRALLRVAAAAAPAAPPEGCWWMGGMESPALATAGLYRVQIAAGEGDDRYFLTGCGGVGLSPDTRSWGFAFRPSAKGTPFGNAEYQRVWLFGDWYTFDVTNDY